MAILTPGQANFEDSFSQYCLGNITLGKLIFEWWFAGDGVGSPSGMTLGGALGSVLDFFWKIVFGKERQPGRDPLVLDLDGDGLELSAFNQSRSPLFDLDGDGFLERTGWVRGDDGLLVRDLNGDGKINSVSELFGNPDQTGFEELASLDENDDGIIDASDSAFGSLRVWQDANEDGVTDAGELKTLAEHDITSLSLTTQDPTSEQVDNNGHTITEISHFIRTTSPSDNMEDTHDVYFKTDEFNTVYTGSISHDQIGFSAFMLGRNILHMKGYAVDSGEIGVNYVNSMR